MAELKRFTFTTVLVLVFKKIESEEKRKYDTVYSNSTVDIIITESDIDDLFQLIYATYISDIQKSLGKSSGWIIHSVIDDTISISAVTSSYRKN